MHTTFYKIFKKIFLHIAPHLPSPRETQEGRPRDTRGRPLFAPQSGTV